MFKKIKIDQIESEAKKEINHAKKHEIRNEYDNGYVVVVETLAGAESAKDQSKKVADMIGLIIAPKEEASEDYWEEVEDVLHPVADRINEASSLHGQFFFAHHPSDGSYCLFYEELDFVPDKQIQNFIEEQYQSYHQKRTRLKELPNLMIDAHQSGTMEELSKLQQEYDELSKIVTAKRQKRLMRKLAWDSSNLPPEETLDQLRDYDVYNTLDDRGKKYYDQLIAWYPNKIVDLLKEKDVSFYGQLKTYYAILGFETMQEMLSSWGFTYVFVTGPRTNYRSEKDLQEDLLKQYPDKQIPSLAHLNELKEDPYIYGQIYTLSKRYNIGMRELLIRWGFVLLIKDLVFEEEIVESLREWYPNGDASKLSLEARDDEAKINIYNKISRIAQKQGKTIKEIIESYTIEDGTNFVYNIKEQTVITEDDVISLLRKWYPDGDASKLASEKEVDKKRIYNKILKMSRKRQIKPKQIIESYTLEDGTPFVYNTQEREPMDEEKVVQLLRKWYPNGDASKLPSEKKQDINKDKVYGKIQKLSLKRGISIKEIIESYTLEDGTPFIYITKSGPKQKKQSTRLIKKHKISRL